MEYKRSILIFKFFPDEELGSIHDLDPAKLKALGKKGIIFDLDNTLGAWGFTELEERVWQKLAELKCAGFEIGILSNDQGKKREWLRAKLDGYPMVFNACKPLAAGYMKLLAQMKLKPAEVVMIGDQLFTDIFGAKRLGIYSILVAPLDRSKESLFTKLRRRLEQLLLKLHHS